MEFVKSEVKQLAESPQSTSEGFEETLVGIFPFNDKVLDRLFETEANKFEKEFKKSALKLYADQEKNFDTEIMRKVERDIYLQVLDNLWMQHLENMNHLREGIHWISVGQRDPLVEYRRQGQHMFEEMQSDLRRETIKALFSARPVEANELDEPTDTELTRAASKSVDNADRIIDAEEFHEEDFHPHDASKKKTRSDKKRKARKAERKRRGKKHK